MSHTSYRVVKVRVHLEVNMQKTGYICRYGRLDFFQLILRDSEGTWLSHLVETCPGCRSQSHPWGLLCAGGSTVSLELAAGMQVVHRTVYNERAGRGFSGGTGGDREVLRSTQWLWVCEIKVCPTPGR